MHKTGTLAVTAGLLAGIPVAVYLMARNWRRHAATPKPAKSANEISPDLVDEASMESFPASDAPSWTGAALP